MGNCLISIHVTGAHHNGMRTDIDQMAADFVEHLKAKGHTVTAAKVVSGSEQDLIEPGARYPWTTVRSAAAYLRSDAKALSDDMAQQAARGK